LNSVDESNELDNTYSATVSVTTSLLWSTVTPEAEP